MATQHPQPGLAHSIYVNGRAIVLGTVIGYGFWYVAHHADQFWPVVWGLLACIIIGTLWTTRFSFEKNYRLNYLVLPVLLYGSALFFFLLLKNVSYQLLFCLAIASIYVFLFRAFSEFREHPSPTRKKMMTQALDVVSVITMFLSFASLQELHFFLSWPLYVYILVGVVLSAVLLYASYWHQRVMTLRAWFFIALGALVMGEYLWALSFLPTGYLTNALLALAGLFLFHALTVATLKSTLRRRIVLEHAAAAGVISVIALFTGHWTPLS